MSIISTTSLTPSRKTSSRLIRESSILLYKSACGEMHTDEYITKMEEMNELLENLEAKMNKVEEKLGEVDELLDRHEQKHSKVIAFEKGIAKEKQSLKQREQQHCELKI